MNKYKNDFPTIHFPKQFLPFLMFKFDDILLEFRGWFQKMENSMDGDLRNVLQNFALKFLKPNKSFIIQVIFLIQPSRRSMRVQNETTCDVLRLAIHNSGEL